MTGAERDTAAYDLTIQAATGALDITGEPDRPPAKLGAPVVDLQTGVAAAVALLAALEKRDRDGVGSSIDISMFDLAINMLGYMGVSYLNLGMIPGRLGSGHQTIYPYNAFETKDHRYIVVAPFTNRFWRSFCEVIGRGDLPDQPEYHDSRRGWRTGPTWRRCSMPSCASGRPPSGSISFGSRTFRPGRSISSRKLSRAPRPRREG